MVYLVPYSTFRSRILLVFFLIIALPLLKATTVPTVERLVTSEAGAIEIPAVVQAVAAARVSGAFAPGSGVPTAFQGTPPFHYSRVRWTLFGNYFGLVVFGCRSKTIVGF